MIVRTVHQAHIDEALALARQAAAAMQLRTEQGYDEERRRPFVYVPAGELLRVAGLVLPAQGLVLRARSAEVTDAGLVRTWHLVHVPSGDADEWTTTTPIRRTVRQDLAVAWARTHSHAAVIRDLLWIGVGDEPDPSEGPARAPKAETQEEREARIERIDEARREARAQRQRPNRATRALNSLAGHLTGTAPAIEYGQAEQEREEQLAAEAERLAEERAAAQPSAPVADPDWLDETIPDRAALEDRLRVDIERTRDQITLGASGANGNGTPVAASEAPGPGALPGPAHTDDSGEAQPPTPLSAPESSTPSTTDVTPAPGSVPPSAAEGASCPAPEPVSPGQGASPAGWAEACRDFTPSPPSLVGDLSAWCARCDYHEDDHEPAPESATPGQADAAPGQGPSHEPSTPADAGADVQGSGGESTAAAPRPSGAPGQGAYSPAVASMSAQAAKKSSSSAANCGQAESQRQSASCDGLGSEQSTSNDTSSNVTSSNVTRTSSPSDSARGAEPEGKNLEDSPGQGASTIQTGPQDTRHEPPDVERGPSHEWDPDALRVLATLPQPPLDDDCERDESGPDGSTPEQLAALAAIPDEDEADGRHGGAAAIYTGPTLTEALAARGLKHRPTPGNPVGKRDVVRVVDYPPPARGSRVEVVLSAVSAREVWEWLALTEAATECSGDCGDPDPHLRSERCEESVARLNDGMPPADDDEPEYRCSSCGETFVEVEGEECALCLGPEVRCVSCEEPLIGEPADEEDGGPLCAKCAGPIREPSPSQVALVGQVASRAALVLGADEVFPLSSAPVAGGPLDLLAQAQEVQALRVGGSEDSGDRPDEGEEMPASTRAEALDAAPFDVLVARAERLRKRKATKARGDKGPCVLGCRRPVSSGCYWRGDRHEAAHVGCVDMVLGGRDPRTEEVAT